MRQIGNIKDSKQAAAFHDFVVLKGVDCDIEREDDGSHAVWIIDEESLEEAEGLLKEFQADPENARYKGLAQKAKKVVEDQIKSEESSKAKSFDSRDILEAQRSNRLGQVTRFFLFASVACFALVHVMDMVSVEDALRIASAKRPGPTWAKGLWEITDGQVWRLITPIILHGDILHIFFNMFWFVHLAGMMERLEGSIPTLVMILIMAVISNLTQYTFAGPNFVGMSGVVYGLLCYAWIREKCDFTSGYFVHPTNFTILIVWFFICWGMPGIANHAHYGGLVGGIALGYTMANLKRR